MISSSQCRAARGLLDWSQQQLADAANVGIVTVRHFEARKVDPRPATLVVIKQALAAAGVEFIEGNGGGEGVRFRKSKKRK
jgi:transcriptional regulator with XRE-family HTH domain